MRPVPGGRGACARVLVAFAMQPLPSQQSADLLEVVEDRSPRRSTIVTTQMPVKQWHEALGDATIADAILDRLIHNAHRIELRGHDSLRDPKRAATGAAPEQRRAQTPAEAR